MRRRDIRVAIVGAGVAGLVTAHLLHPDHEITVFEAASEVGGHVHAVPVETPEGRFEVDTGFIVFNEERYPAFTRLLEGLGVASRASDMSFSVRCSRTGLEFQASSLTGLFAQPRNLLRPRFFGMLLDVRRFRQEAQALAEGGDPRLTLGAFLAQGRYGAEFCDRFLVPMGAAIWSADPLAMRSFPARSFARFFLNHRFLDVRGQPQWRTVVGGSPRYVEALIRPFRDSIRTASPVEAVTRDGAGVNVRVRGAGGSERFDRVVLATHSDQSLAMLADADAGERAVLGAFGWQQNEVVLHDDPVVMPRRRSAWASWNWHVPAEPAGRPTVTYDMSRLQGLPTQRALLVTLNDAGTIDPSRVKTRHVAHHPVFTPESIAAQQRHAEIDGRRRTHFCGAWWGDGFHEDGVQSALVVVDAIRRAA